LFSRGDDGKRRSIEFMVQRLGRVVSVSALSETSPSHESVGSTQRRPTRPRIRVDSVDSAL